MTPSGGWAVRAVDGVGVEVFVHAAHGFAAHRAFEAPAGALVEVAEGGATGGVDLVAEVVEPVQDEGREAALLLTDAGVHGRHGYFSCGGCSSDR